MWSFSGGFTDIDDVLLFDWVDTVRIQTSEGEDERSLTQKYLDDKIRELLSVRADEEI